MARPNVLMISVDHWPGRLFGALGHPAVLTPTMDRLIENGVAFTNAYSTTPSCIPARREMHTGTLSPTHGDRVFNERLVMPDLPTLAQTFREAGYQAYAVGKLHVYPQRDRIGFDDVLLDEEGRHHLGMQADDYELFLAEQGYAGQELTHGLGNNDYSTRPWHLPEYCHSINWTAQEMSKFIHRRDPKKPGFWFMSFHHPHPPLAPLAEYMDIYRDIEIDAPHFGDWTKDPGAMPFALQLRRHQRDSYPEAAVRMARQAFYALCTHIDHQVRLVIGVLREEGLVDDTAVLVTADHGDMLGNHGLYAKSVLYDDAAKIPMILAPQLEYDVGQRGRTDDRLTGLADVMPTLLELCDVPVPDSVEGQSLLGDRRRDFLYGEHNEDAEATRMVRDRRHKLIYYPVGNRSQLFDLVEDPDEMRDVADDPDYAKVRAELTELLKDQLYGSDLDWLDHEELVGVPDLEQTPRPKPDRGMGNQRGWRFM